MKKIGNRRGYARGETELQETKKFEPQNDISQHPAAMELQRAKKK